jgi:adenylate cyclase
MSRTGIRAITLILLLIIAASCTRVETQLAEKGHLNLASTKFPEDEVSNLNGEWEFYWMQLLSPDESAIEWSETTSYINIPGTWNNKSESGEQYTAHGYATLRLKITLPEEDHIYALYIPPMLTAYKLWVNGTLLAQNGSVGTEAAKSVPDYHTNIKLFTAHTRETEIICQISNFHYRKGGMWSPIRIGEPKPILHLRDTNTAIALFLCGAFIIMALYHLGIYYFRNQELSSLLFAIFCLTFTIRIITTGDVLLSYFIQGINWSLLIKLELFPLFFGGPIFLQFFKSLFPDEMGNFIRRIIIGSALTAGLFIIVLPVVYANYLVPVLEVIVLLGMLYISICLVNAIRHHRPGAHYVLIAFVIFFATGINDILFALELIQTSYLLPIGLFIFILAESFLLAKNIARSYTNVEHLSSQLTRANLSMSRFVPNEFLAFLNKKSIVDVKLGDQHLQEMTILFCDICSFTTLSERMNPQQNFNFLNSYLQRIGPVIRKNGGFIDKYIGDEIMALFPNSPDDAVKTAKDIFKAIEDFNKLSVPHGYPTIEVGIGIHTGNIMLGIIGEDQRIESTVISDTVNLASRIERLTRLYKADILISGNTMTKLHNLKSLHMRMIDIVQVRGKTEESALFEVYDSNSPEIIKLKDETKEELEYAIELYNRGEMQNALQLFNKLLQIFPDDGVAQLYIKRCNQYIKTGLPKDWSGVSRFEG